MQATVQTSETFADFMTGVAQDETKLKLFGETATDAHGLRTFASVYGFSISDSEAERIFSQAHALVSQHTYPDRISDELLDNVNGGLSFAAIGGIIGGIGGAGALALAVGFMAAPVTGGASLVAAVATLGGLSGGAALSVAAGSVVAGAVAGGAGAVAGHFVDASA